jgi:hypothetical protein
MATTAMDTVQKIRLSAVFIALVCSKLTFAGDWKFDPSIIVDETYSDNVSLVSNNKDSSLVSQTGVVIDSTYNAKHAIFNFSSQSFYALYSHNHELDNDYHTLASNFRLQLWPNGIILVGDANISNQPRDSNRNALADIVSADTLRAETYNGGIEYNINNSVFIINSAINYSQTKYEDSLGDRQGVTARVNSNNGTSARHIFWEVEHNYQELKNNNQNGKLSESEVKIGLISDYHINPFIRYYTEDNSGNVSNSNNSLESDSYGLGVRWLVSPRFYLDASYNKPNGSKLNIDGEEQKEYINAAIRWQPTIRTTLEANISERFFGNSFGLNFVHRNKRLTNSINYTENVQTLTRNNFLASIVGFYLCPNSNPTSIEECIVQNDSTIIPNDPSAPNSQGNTILSIQDFTLVEDNVFSLNKTLSWNSTLDLSRTNISFNANKRIRDNLDTRVEDESSTVSLSIRRRVNSRSSFNFNISYTESNLQVNTESESTNNYRRYQLSYEKSLRSTLSFNLALSYLNRSSDNTTLNYQESRVSAKITKGF